MSIFSSVGNIISDVIGIGGDFLGGVTGETQRDAGKQAKKIAKKNAKLTREQLDEAIRRTELANEQVLGATLARQGASGIKVGAGTTDDFLSEMQTAFQQDIDWRKKVGDQQVDIIKEGGQLVDQQATAAGWGTAASSTLAIASLWI